MFPIFKKGVIKAVVFRDAKDLKDDPTIHLAAAAAAAAAAYGRHSVGFIEYLLFKPFKLIKIKSTFCLICDIFFVAGLSISRWCNTISLSI